MELEERRGRQGEPRLKLALTHEEIAQMIGTSRETVTRLFADLKRRQIVQAKGSTLLIRNKAALRRHGDCQLAAGGNAAPAAGNGLAGV